MSSNNNRLRKPSTLPSRQTVVSMHWLFRSNIPRKRASYIQPDIRKRNFFGMGEIIGVLTNPAETVRSLTESKRLLEEARQEINESRERAQIRPKHTFSKLPGFFARQNEVEAVERVLEGEPAFTVLFGASSVGKTALLREVLTHENYHVLHFDLRISGFADLSSLYMSLSRQMEQYFESIAQQMEGYDEFEKEAWSFKHDRLNVERRINEASENSGLSSVKTSDIARLMELFQSSLLKYWEFEPRTEDEDKDKSSKSRSHHHPQGTSDSNSDRTRVNLENNLHNGHIVNSNEKLSKKSSTWRFRSLLGMKGKHKKGQGQQQHEQQQQQQQPQQQPQQPQQQQPPRTLQRDGSEEERRETRPVKKMPVIFFDEAHKLPALIHSTEAMNCLLSTFLVLTKQDRLCHVIHATSDPFYHTWLRQLNIMQHCKIITIGDCTKAETRAFFRERLLSRVPEQLRHKLQFEALYEAFGGKLVHWQDYITDFVNSNGTLEVKKSSHFLQAHALLNLHIIHSSQSPASQDGAEQGGGRNQETGTNADTLHPAAAQPPPTASTSGFKIYSPISHGPGVYGGLGGGGIGFGNAEEDRCNAMVAGYYSSDFTAMQLLKVMSRITQPNVTFLPYFMLCREFGVRAIDGMVKGRVFDLRWTETVTKENAEEPMMSELDQMQRPTSMGARSGVGGSPIGLTGSEEGDMIALSDRELMMQDQQAQMMMSMREPDPYESAMEVVGSKLVPTTPIMRYAIREVLAEYEEDPDSGSDYASLTDVEEY
ncbi:hypothetical protein K435DRAFT_870311 [Dendrothele bispora CBS 962.96]|uniref:AAA+ ATPase domain-containing protein n=1 Tax=Dendrothele bispora (strain CBS 962.96) TaxID=1314807 RepID=A0A4S8L7B6_DENBC|nr:hypothetical protein K435DRAFT_870311 [Dendrothele bispora CBS 962.96]